MGHSVIDCGNCGSYIMEGRNEWKCEKCGWYMDCTKYPHGTMELSENLAKNLMTTDKNLEEPIYQASAIDVIKTFTMNHKNLEISFEDGAIVMRNWDIRLNQPMDYRCDTIEQLEELMGAWEVICKFKMGVEE